MEGRISILIDILFILVFKKVRNPGKIFGILTPTLDNIMPVIQVFESYHFHCLGLIIKHNFLTCIADIHKNGWEFTKTSKQWRGSQGTYWLNLSFAFSTLFL